MLAETARFRGEGSLVMFDIGHFKKVNDSRGVRSVGVMGDERTYDNVVGLRAVTQAQTG